MFRRDAEEIVRRASEISSFNMSPFKIAERRIDYLTEFYSLEEREIEGFLVRDWGCEVIALGRHLPCLPAGLGRANKFVVSNYEEFSNAGTLVFDGHVLPRVRKILLTPALVIPKDFKNLALKAMRYGDFKAETWGKAVEARAYIKKGGEICFVTFYDALWYGFAHSATSIAALTYYKSNATLIFVPRYSNWYKLVLDCSTTILIDGIGVSEKGLDSEELYLTIGGLSEYYGSPFDTPDKASEDALKRHLRLLSHLLK